MTGPYASLDEKSATNNLRILYATVYHLAGAFRSTIESGIGISKSMQNTQGTAYAKTLNINFGIPANQSPDGQKIPNDAIVTFPCNDISGVSPVFGSESPDPFPNTNRDINPYGQPIYLMSSNGTTLTLTNWQITQRGGTSVPVTVLTKENDPHKRLTANQVFVVPTKRLADNSTYDVVLSGTNSGMISSANPTGSFNRIFSFSTGTFTSE